MSQFTQMLGIRLGLEDLVDEVAPVPTPGDGIDSEVTESFIATDSAESEVEDTASNIAKLEDTTASLERIAFALESMSGRQLSDDALVFLNIGMENAMQPFRPAADQSTGSGDSKEAKKGIVAKLIAAWDAFVQMMKKLWDSISGYFQRLFSTAASMRKKAAAILASARSVKDTAGGKKFEMNANEIQCDGKIPAPAEFVSKLTELAKSTTDGLVGQYSLAGRGYIEDLIAKVKSIGDSVPDDATFDSHGDKKAAFFAMKDVTNLKEAMVNGAIKISYGLGITADASADVKKDAGEATYVKMSKSPFIGDRVFVFTCIKDAKPLDGGKHSDFVAWCRSIKFSVVDSGATRIERGEVEALSVEQLATVCGDVMNTCDAILKFKDIWFKEYKTFSDYNDAFRDQMKKITNIYLTDTEKQKLNNNGGKMSFMDLMGLDFIQALKALNSGVATTISGFGRFENELCKQAMRNSHAALTYAERSLKEHTTPAKAE